MSFTSIALALITMALMLGLLAILVRRKLYRQFPVFFLYCLWTLIVGIVRFLVSRHPLAYFLVYWLTEASYFVVALIAMLLVAERFIEVVQRQSRLIFVAALAFVAVFSLLMAVYKPVGGLSARFRFASGIYVFVVLMCLVEIVLFLAFLYIRSRYDIDWSTYETGIVIGFGILAFLTFVAYLRTLLFVFHIRVGPLFDQLFQYFPPGAAPAAILAWLVAFWRPEPPLPPYDPPDHRKYQRLAQVFEEAIENLRESWRRLGLRMQVIGRSGVD